MNQNIKEKEAIKIVAIETIVDPHLLQSLAKSLHHQDLPQNLPMQIATEKDMVIKVIIQALEIKIVVIVAQEGTIETTMIIMIKIEKMIRNQEDVVMSEKIVTKTITETIRLIILISKTKKVVNQKMRKKDGMASNGFKDQDVHMIQWQIMLIAKWKKLLVLIRKRIKSV